ncbi:MarR family transcriptional regulator [Pseudomonas sp. Z1-14]|uniref:MarR family winged helix-turn-helix transcriptional regulator n=1 Tax=Pseudomonas sp. Z1-14 TaxID=2817409 RepID=UPI003DAA2CC3
MTPKINQDVTQLTPTELRESWPYFWIHRVNSFYSRAIEKRLKSLGVDDPRWRVMMTLYETEYMSVSEIAEFTTLRLNTVTKIIQRMISDQLVMTRVRPSDRRVTDVCLTKRGEELRAKAMIEVMRIRDESFFTSSPEELRLINKTLEKIANQLSRIV